MTTRDGRFTIVFNGEIFNAPQLRVRYEAQGVEFFTDHSDTEVVLQGYALEGEEVLNRLNGMFAFALYDRDKRMLCCVRDHAGIKPFYYTEQGGRLAFASEMKSLLGLPFVARELNLQSFFHYLSLMYVPGEETIFRGIKRLPPGHALFIHGESRAVQVKRWWKPAFRPHVQRSPADWKELLRGEITDAIRRWTLADVTIGCSLSGGLDSSTIVGVLASGGQKVKTYSLGFTGAGESSWDELPRSRAVAKFWGTDHHELVMTPETLLDELLSMVWHLDEPYGGGLPSWAVFKFMSRDVKVGLTGTGGDELFGHYGKWRYLEGRGFLGWRRRRELVDRAIFEREFFDRYYYFSDGEKKKFLAPEKFDAVQNTADVLYGYYRDAGTDEIRNAAAFTDLSTQLPEEFLMMTDRFSMAHSLEARTPFLDRAFMDFVFSIPAAVRTKPLRLKYLLRETMAGVLPREIRHARKKGFVMPLSLWLRGKLRPLAQHLLDPARLEKQGFLRPEFFDHFVQPHLEGRADHTQKVWAALMFQLWHHVFIESRATEKPAYNWRALV